MKNKVQCFIIVAFCLIFHPLKTRFILIQLKGKLYFSAIKWIRLEGEFISLNIPRLIPKIIIHFQFFSGIQNQEAIPGMIQTSFIPSSTSIQARVDDACCPCGVPPLPPRCRVSCCPSTFSKLITNLRYQFVLICTFSSIY